MKALKHIARATTLALIIAGFGATSTFGQFTDTTPPTLVSATFTPNPVDVTGSDATVTLALHMTDDLSGVDFQFGAFTGYLIMAGPSGQTFTLYSWQFQCTSGNPGDLDTVWETSFTVFRGTENGDWNLQYLALYDRAGNLLWSDGTGPVTVGPLTINSVSDTTPPVASEPVFSTDAGTGINTVDTSAGPQTVTLQLHITDDISGFGLDDGSFIDNDQSTIFAQNQENNTLAYAYLSRVSGDRNDGIWQCTFWFPQYSPTGYWNINLSIRDNAKNLAYFGSDSLLDQNNNPAQIIVASDPTDMNPPTISAVELSPITIDTSASDAQVNATVTVADDLSGVAYVGVFLRSPSGAQQRYIYCYPPNPGFLSGTLTGSTIFPRYSEAGTWKVYYIYLGDAVNNAQWINNPAAQGLDATLNVILPSLDTDGSVSSAGGTIEDAVFGSRASITFPPGAVAGDTTAAIDVLTSPLDIPLPSGFAGANTFYVNIHLDPEPNFPLGPPGLTIVLPLTHPMTPGTTLNLYRVNTTTGQLEASLGVDGNPVIGTVDPGGLSATFTGVARLSTVVGLLPDPVITWNNPANIVYGTALSGLQLNASANVPGQFSYTPAAGTVLNAGPNQNLKVTFTPDDAVNYQPVTKTVTISVDKARLKITADNKAKIAGEPLPVFTASFDAFVNGDTPASLSAAPVFSTLATPASPAGNYDINVSGAASDNYDIAYAKGTLTVLASIQLAPVEYSLVSSRRVAATVWEYVYRFKLKNNSPTKAYGVSAQLNTWPTQVTIVDGAVTFGNINAGQTIQSQDTFTIRVDRSKPVRNSDLSWRVTYAYSSGGLFTTSVNLPLK